MKIAICDDEEYYIHDIVSRIQQLEEQYSDLSFHIDTFQNGKDLLHTFQTKDYDLVYLDIELTDINGMNTAKHIHDIKPSCMIIFVTSHMSYFNQSYIVNAFQYMKKPLKEKLFNNEFKRAVKNYQFYQKTMIFPTTVGNIVMNIHDIIFLESAYKRYKLYTTKGVYYGSLKPILKYREQLQEYHFFQIQRSFTINLAHIKTLDQNFVFMSNDEMLKISRKKYKEFKKVFYKFLNK
ncbi:LytR/AlgR family response regulator transcription factor [Candidatus Stoquefichus massiliensis]|uniref:LytR/AlgR family response regulator transcription factor n=1 Tax=Candidatus Stoquefichus massiliensis TaxID=1470350 RepID=UPI00047F14B6|nr:LytTR family DNA-binding domain-containing protein [Candidatus Stoquefichus massiliensis]